MSYTEKQKAYFLRKARTAVKWFDINKDGYFSGEDIELMAERMIEYGKLPEEQVRQSFRRFSWDVWKTKQEKLNLITPIM